MSVCTLFYDTVYKCNILNAAEKHLLLLCEHFYNEIWSEHPTAAYDCIYYVSEVCLMVVKCGIQVECEVGGQYLWR